MVYWINRVLGVKASFEELDDQEKGSIILDLRNLVDGTNDPTKLLNTIKNAVALYTIARQRNLRLILQCQAGVSRSPAIAACVLVLECDFEWNEAIELVRKKCPVMNVNLDLLDQLKSIFT